MCRSIVAGLVTAILVAGAANAQERVEIRSNDGALVIRGEIQPSDNDVYVVNSAVGMLTIPRELASCTGAACPPDISDQKEFNITGASVAGGDLLVRLIAGYAEAQSAEVFVDFVAETRTMQMNIANASDEQLATVSISRADSTTAYEKLLSGESQVILATRRPTDEERAAFAAAGKSNDISSANEVVLALDGLAIVVADGNPLRSISLDDAAGIFSGQIDNWAAFGGPDAPIRVVASGTDTATSTFFQDQVLGPRQTAIMSSLDTATSEEEVVSIVRDDARAIGLTTITAATNVKALPIRQACGLVAPPTSFAVKSEEYPLARRLFLYSLSSGIPARAQEFIDYALSDTGQQRIAEAGFVSQSVEQRDMNAFGMRLATALISSSDNRELRQLRTMADELVDSVQLSSTLRFRTGSAELDSKALSDIQRLAKQFNSPQFGNREVILVGFTDSIGRVDLNNILSQRRALQVRESIVAASEGALDPRLVKVLGFGPTAPIGCNDSVEGRDVNRRVEVWVKDAG
ncbi:MAG: phosphate ABC transporter substrate-binding/OmpA family protein [Pseudomonadota bacterium]